MCTFSQSIKKGSRTHPTPLGIVRRRPPQFQTYYSIGVEIPRRSVDQGLSTSPNYYIIFSLMFISSMDRNHKVNGDLSANNMTIMKLRQLLYTPPLLFLPHFPAFGVENHIRQVLDLILIRKNI